MGGGGDGDAANETGTSKSNVGPVAAVFGSDGSGGGGDGGGGTKSQYVAHARSAISPDASQHFPPEQAELWHPSTKPQHPPGRLRQAGRPRTLAVHSSTDAVISCARWHPNSQLCRWNSGLLSFFSVLSGKLRLAMHAASAAAGGGVLGGVGGICGGTTHWHALYVPVPVLATLQPSTVIGFASERRRRVEGQPQMYVQYWPLCSDPSWNQTSPLLCT